MSKEKLYPLSLESVCFIEHGHFIFIYCVKVQSTQIFEVD